MAVDANGVLTLNDATTIEPGLAPSKVVHEYQNDVRIAVLGERARDGYPQK